MQPEASSIDSERLEKAINWNIKRQKARQIFQLVFGVMLILTMTALQVSLCVLVDSTRIMLQGCLVFLQAIILYCIIISISQLRFASSSCIACCLCLTYYNDS